MRLRSRLVGLGVLVLVSCQGAGPQAPRGQQGAAGRGERGDGAPIAVAPAAAAGGARVGFVVPESPIGLTASDGTGLALRELRAQAVVDGPLAYTELHLTFDNPLDRQLEGTFRIALPQGASLARFAMKIGSEWQEGEVVELAAARRAYEDFLHRKQDPALMEKAAGNEFSARVFPIPARGTKEILVAYAHEVNEGPYVLPLRGLPELGALDVSAFVAGSGGSGGQPQRLTAQRTTPSADFVVDRASAASAAPAARGVRSGELAIVRVRPQSAARPDPIASAIVLVDTSASRALGFEDELRLVDRLVKQLAAGKAEVTVAAFDQSVAPIFEGRAADFGPRELEKLRARGALGASDLSRALAWTKDQAKRASRKRVLLVTDGVATAGATEAKTLVADVAALKEAGVERVDALAVGGIRDDAGLLRLVRGQLAKDGVVADALADTSSALRRIGEATRSGVPVKVDGASWVYPTKLDGVQAGDAYSIYVELPENKPLTVSVDGKAPEVIDLRKTARPLVERSIAQAKIASMLEREATQRDGRDDLKKGIVALAVAQRIMTPYTAMLVLETEDDYARFHIDRKSLKEVLAIEGGAVKRMQRKAFSLPRATPRGGDSEEDRDGDGILDADAMKDAPAAKAATAEAPRAPRPEPRPRPRPRQPGPPPPSEAPKAQTAAPAPAPAAPRATRPAPAGGGGDPSSERVLRDALSNASGASAGAAPASEPAPAPRRAPEPRPRDRSRGESVDPVPSVGAFSVTGSGAIARDEENRRAPYEGRFASIMDTLKSSAQKGEALGLARAWQKESPGDVLALVALGEAAEANAMTELAARAYGSVIDLFPNRADLRRFAGERLERVANADAVAMSLAIDSFRKAVADRPDHPSSHRLLAFALLRAKQYDKAFDAALAGLRHGYEVDRFAGVDRILREDLGLVGAAWARAEPARRDEILGRVQKAGGRIEDQPSLRFVLDWQTDANDVDFHIHDARGGHAFFSSPHLASGGDLYADVTTGYGPECFTIRLPKERRSSYRLEAHYYSRGPMGYGMGKLEVIDHDGKGNLVFEERPFIVMVDEAYVDLGSVK